MSGDARDGLPAPGGRAWCVCVPARNEAERLGVLLAALADQDIAGPVPVVVALNNTTDRSVQVVERAAARHGTRLSIRLDQFDFPPPLAHAGSARATAMAVGLEHLNHDPDAVLISTDADTRPPPDWIRQNLAAIDSGADLVGGRLVLDDAEPLAAAVLAARALWDAYWVRVRAIEDEIDPSDADPAPRHGDHTGASLAITVDAYRAAGGVPLFPTGEDQALVCAAVAAGRRLVHPLEVWTRVSARTDGRAAGGMAEEMRRLQTAADSGEAPMAPAYDHWRARAEWRRDLRSRRGSAAVIAEEGRLAPMPHDMPLAPLRATAGSS